MNIMNKVVGALTSLKLNIVKHQGEPLLENIYKQSVIIEDDSQIR